MNNREIAENLDMTTAQVTRLLDSAMKKINHLLLLDSNTRDELRDCHNCIGSTDNSSTNFGSQIYAPIDYENDFSHTPRAILKTAYNH